MSRSAEDKESFLEEMVSDLDCFVGDRQQRHRAQVDCSNMVNCSAGRVGYKYKDKKQTWQRWVATATCCFFAILYYVSYAGHSPSTTVGQVLCQRCHLPSTELFQQTRLCAKYEVGLLRASTNQTVPSLDHHQHSYHTAPRVSWRAQAAGQEPSSMV